MTPRSPGAGGVDTIWTSIERRPRLLVAALTALVVLPLVAALIDLTRTHWYPVLDLAMTEFRVRDVFGGDTPLIGLPGRIGEAPNRGSHPGPLSFYLLAPTYRLLGAGSWALLAATVVIHTAAVATAIWIGRRRLGVAGALAVAALVAVLVRGYGQVILTQPWNPYLPLLAWVVVLLAGWSILDGDAAMAVPMVIAGSLCAQTHIPYLIPAGSLTIVGVLLALRRSRRWGAIAAGVGAVLWLPPVIDQAINSPGNIRRLLDHFGSPSEDPLGLGSGIKLALRHFDVWNGFVGQVAGSGKFVVESSPVWGAVTLVVWALAAAYAWRFGPPSLRHLHLAIAAAGLIGTVSITRIFGLPWYYLTLWLWPVAALAVGAILWTAVDAWRRWSRPAFGSVARPVGLTAAGVVVVATIASTLSFASAEIPEPRLSAIIAAIADDTAAALDPDTTYVVRWSDAADMGSPGYGLLNELERRGADVVADPYFRDTVTPHRTTAADAELHLATGAYIDAWRALPEAEEIAFYEPRDAAAIAAYESTRAALVDRLNAEGLGDLVAGVDQNLFGTSLDTRLSAADQDDFTALLDAGQPVAVFLAPLGADPLAL